MSKTLDIFATYDKIENVKRICVATIIFMFVTLAKQGDERRDMIVGKARTKTFVIFALYVAFDVVRDMYKILSGTDLSPEGMNPFVTLVTISLTYIVALIYYKKKYGD